MATTKDIQNLFHRLMDLKDEGFDVVISDSNLKNYVSYIISKEDGNARYEDCIIIYNGDPDDKYPENVCKPEDIPVEELLKRIDEIVAKIIKVFE